MTDQSRPRRSPTRYLAPLALAALVIATYVVVQHAEGTGSSSATTSSTSSTGTHSSTTHSSRQARGKKGTATATYYVVKSGDSLSIISARTGVPLPTLEILNPGVSSNSLQVGQRLRLRR